MGKRMKSSRLKKIPMLRYSDLWDIMCLEHRNHLNGVVLNDVGHKRDVFCSTFYPYSMKNAEMLHL